jgi:hypothetical protein
MTIQTKLDDTITTVENIKSVTFDRKNTDNVYIGRANSYKGLKQSKWHNPYTIGKDGNREEVIEKYKKYFWNSPELVEAITELKGKTLYCWCKPLPCHGDFLAEQANNAIVKTENINEEDNKYETEL